MPLSINWVKMAGELLAGPMVQTILAFRMFIWKRLHAAHPAEGGEHITDPFIGYLAGGGLR